MRAGSGRLLCAVAVGYLFDLAGLPQLVQLACDNFGIEIQAFGEIPGGAPGILDDALALLSR